MRRPRRRLDSSTKLARQYRDCQTFSCSLATYGYLLAGATEWVARALVVYLGSQMIPPDTPVFSQTRGAEQPRRRCGDPKRMRNYGERQVVSFDARYILLARAPISCTTLIGCFITFTDMRLSPVLVCGVGWLALIPLDHADSPALTCAIRNYSDSY